MGHDVSDQALPSPRPWALSILHSVGSISSNRTNRSNNLRLHSQAALTLRRQSDTAGLQWGHLARVPPWAVTKDQPSKKTSRKKLFVTLWKSLASGTPVQVQRSMEPHEVLEGVVVELGGTWVLLAGIRDGAYLNGYHALRLQDLVRVEAHATFVPFLRRRRSWPPAAPISFLDPSEAWLVITAGASLTGVVSVYREATRPGTLLIGALDEWEKKSLPLTA